MRNRAKWKVHTHAHTGHGQVKYNRIYTFTTQIGLTEASIAQFNGNGSRRSQTEILKELLTDQAVKKLYHQEGGLSPFAHYILTFDRKSYTPLSASQWYDMAANAEIYLSGETSPLCTFSLHLLILCLTTSLCIIYINFLCMQLFCGLTSSTESRAHL
jgi:hypothetical protein